MWPHFSNIDEKIYNKIITGRATGSIAEKGFSVEREHSKKNCWVRVFSGANNGLIMYSNPDWGLFQAVGDTIKDTLFTYGYQNGSGPLGVDWYGKVVRADDGWSGRPSPIITGITLKEGKDQISRECEITLTCHTLGQMEKIQEYLMEPGYSLLIEYGYNSESGVSKMIPIDTTKPLTIAKAAGDNNLDQDELHKRRVASYGDYDSFFGFIVGGTTSANGSAFDVTIKLRGAPGLPTYLQSHNILKKYNVDKDGNELVDNTAIAPKFQISDLNMVDTKVKGYVGQRRFKYYFNNLPEHRRTYGVRQLYFASGSTRTGYTESDFINMDPVVTRTINAFKSAATIDNGDGTITTTSINGKATGSVDGTVTKTGGGGSKANETVAPQGGDQETASPDVVTAGGFHIPKEKIFSDKEFVRFEKVVELLNQNEGLTAYKIGGKKIYITVDISDTIIGAFKGIYSTDPDKLIIPGEIPDFSVFFLSEKEVTMAYPPTYINVSPNKDSKYAFAQATDLTTGPHREKAYHWGYLKNLYINFELVKSVLNEQNLTIREVMQKLLNEMSNAANGFWNFQIVEKKDQNNKTTRWTVIDENWVGKNEESPRQFFHNGEQSRFLSAALTIDIPGEMTNQIIAKRLSFASQPNAPTLKVGGLFNAKKDLFLAKVEMVKAKEETNSDVAMTVDVTVFDQNNDDHKKEITFANKEIAEKYNSTLKDYNTNKTDKEKKLAEAKADYDKKSSDASAIAAVNMSTGAGVPIVGDAIAATIDFFTGGNNATITNEVIKTAIDESIKSANAAKAKWEELDKDLAAYTADTKKAVLDILKDNDKTKESSLSANFDKICILPDPTILDIPPADLNNSVFDKTVFATYFKIYACRDVAFFDVLKQNAFGGGDSKTGRYSHPLPIKYEFTIYGTSGIRRGDTFNIVGIPRKYRDNGLFQITAVEQEVKDMQWTTRVIGEYRQQQ
jgi:hypothetical protein